LTIAIGFFPLLKNLDFSNTSLDRHAEMEEKILMISATLSLDVLEFEESLSFRTLGINLLTIPFLKELFFLFMLIISQPDL